MILLLLIKGNIIDFFFLKKKTILKRRESKMILNKHLGSRPTKDELKKFHILPGKNKSFF